MNNLMKAYHWYEVNGFETDLDTVNNLLYLTVWDHALEKTIVVELSQAEIDLRAKLYDEQFKQDTL
jgi:SHS2 domain-containing protein